MKPKPERKRFKFARIKYLIAAAALLFAMLPDMLVKSTQVTARAFITAIGVDRTDDGGYELSAQLLTPQNPGGGTEQQKQSLVSSKGKTLKTAIDGVSSKTGKEANLAHCKLLFLGRSVIEEGLINNLAFFMRSPDVDNGLMIAASSGAAKDNLTKLSEFEKESAFSLSDFFSQNRSSDLNAAVVLKTFMEDYYEGVGDLSLPVIDVRGAELSDEFKTAVIKNGRLAEILDKEPTKTLLWLDQRVTSGTILLENGGEGADKTALNVRSKTAAVKTAFRDGKPVCSISLNFKLFPEEGGGFGGGEFPLTESKKRGEAIALAVREKITADILELRRRCADGGFDVMRINEHFFRFNNRKYKAYLAAGGNITRDCTLEIKVKADVKI